MDKEKVTASKFKVGDEIKNTFAFPEWRIETIISIHENSMNLQTDLKYGNFTYIMDIVKFPKAIRKLTKLEKAMK